MNETLIDRFENELYKLLHEKYSINNLKQKFRLL
jgi:hypothetical protein